MIIRLVETAGKPTRARVRLPAWGRTIEASLGAHEIRTLFLPDNPAADVREVNLIEWE